MTIQSLNPATEKIIETFDPFSDEQIEAALDGALAASVAQKALMFTERATRMRRAADILEEDCDRFAETITTEMGKTLTAAKAEVNKCAWVCRYYADRANHFLGEEWVETEGQRSAKRYLPLGPVLAVMPWNFPFWQVFRFAAPALMAGNTGLLKHASNVPQSALAIEEIFRRAEFPHGAFQTLLVGSNQVAGLIADPRVRAATLTGSGPAGSAVAATAGKHIKKTVLELGGSDPFIVMPSADLDQAVPCAVTGRTQNNGQSCIAAKRFIVHADVYDTFRDAFVAAFEALKVGDPTDPETDIGPLATREGRQDCDELVNDVLKKGGTRLTGAQLVDGAGFFYRPGVIEVPASHAGRYSEEIFGPVALLFKVSSLDEAIEVGNATPFGLGSAIFTEDRNEMEAAFDRLDAGSTFVNTIVASNPHLPFGGVKESGYGRELAADGIREFTNIKTIYVA